MNPDSRVRRAHLPTRVTWQHAAQNSDILLVSDIGQARAAAFPCCTLAPGASILLDFGRELHGSLQLVSGPIPGKALARMRLRFGESASEAMGAPDNDHALHDFPILLPPMSAQEYGMTGFRFARLDNTGEVDVPIVAARAISLMRPLEQIGSFRCDDERLNQIWRVGADTVALCMQDFLWDGIKRDRLVWMGDLHPEVSVVSAVWGAHPIVPQSLDWVRDHTHQNEWMNGIGSYSLWWIIIQRDWYRAHGDRKYLDEQRAVFVGIVAPNCRTDRRNGRGAVARLAVFGLAVERDAARRRRRIGRAVGDGVARGLRTLRGLGRGRNAFGVPRGHRKTARHPGHDSTRQQAGEQPDGPRRYGARSSGQHQHSGGRSAARAFDVLRLLRPASACPGGRLCGRFGSNSPILGRDARFGRDLVLGTFRVRVGTKRRAH